MCATVGQNQHLQLATMPDPHSVVHNQLQSPRITETIWEATSTMAPRNIVHDQRQFNTG